MGSKDSLFYHKKTLNINGNIVELQKPKVMGILNVTPDSFFDGGKHTDHEQIFAQVRKLKTEGADIIDIGGQSTRPGADLLDDLTEWKRIEPAIEIVISEFPEVSISVDTFYQSVAEKAVKKGCHIINDISAGRLDKQMLPFICSDKVPYIMMHSRGTPSTMKQLTQYDNLLAEIAQFFSQRLDYCYKNGFSDVIIDPGIGFAKTVAQNYALLKNLEYFHIFNLPVLVGVSRKSMIYKTLGTKPEESLNGTTVLNTISLLKQVSILRVHDVKEAKEAIDLVDHLI